MRWLLLAISPLLLSHCVCGFCVWSWFCDIVLWCYFSFGNHLSDVKQLYLAGILFVAIGSKNKNCQNMRPRNTMYSFKFSYTISNKRTRAFSTLVNQFLNGRAYFNVHVHYRRNYVLKGAAIKGKNMLP